MKLDETKSTAPEKNPSLFMPKAKETVSNKIKKTCWQLFLSIVTIVCTLATRTN